MAVQTLTAPSRATPGIATPAALPAVAEQYGQARHRRARFQWWQPGWPLTYLLTAYPLWWLLGLTEPLLLLAAAIMAVQMVRTHRITVRRGFGWWMLFLAWVVVGVLLLQVNAPGAIPGASSTRYVTFVFRYCLYLSATIVLLYIYNFRSRIPTTRILRAFAWFFVTVVGGGVLGASAPYLNFPSAMELVLPHGISHVQFVHSLIHPVVAQVVDPNHPTRTPRTSAPFAYTNDWGLSFACLLPFFLLAWFDRQAGWRRHAAPWVLLVAVFPVVQSQNRGLWIALIVSGLVVVIRAAVFGNIKFAIAGVVGAVLAVAVLLSTPLGATITSRLTTSGSEGNRATLGNQTLKSVAEKSPVVGLGTTRPVQGSFYSIAGGDSPDCIGCSPPPLGTQGHFWLVAFSTGYGGLVLYLGFILIQLFRHIRLRSRIGTLGVVVLVVHLSTMLIYDTIGMQLVIIFAAIGLLWREKAEVADARTGRVPPDPTIGGYTALVRRNTAFVVVCALLGVVGGIGFQHARGIDHEAVTSVVVPIDPSSPIANGTGLTVDTLAKLIGTPGVSRAVAQVVGSPLYPGGERLFVTAKQDSRVLQIHVVDRRGDVAVRAGQAAGAALVAGRMSILQRQRADDLRALEEERSADLAGVATIEGMRGADQAATPITGQRNQLVNEIELLDKRILKLQTAPIDAGQVLDTPPARAETDARLVAATSGLMIGILVAILILLARRAYGRRLASEASEYGDLPVLARMTCPQPEDPEGALVIDRTAAALAAIGPATVLSADDSHLRCTVAAALDRAVEQRRGRTDRRRPAGGPIVLVTGPDTTDRALDHARNGIDAFAAPIAGVVALSESPGQPRRDRRHRIPWHAPNRRPEKRR